MTLLDDFTSLSTITSIENGENGGKGRDRRNANCKREELHIIDLCLAYGVE